jgi:hypothetical protein
LGVLLLDGILQANVWFPLVMYQGPLFMSFGRYFVSFCLVFLPVMYLGDVYLLFGWHSAGYFVSFTCVLLFGCYHMDFLNSPVYYISSVSIGSYCYPIVHRSLPSTCVVHPVDIRVFRTSSNSSRGMQVMEMWLKIIIQREETYGDLIVHLARFTLWRST